MPSKDESNPRNQAPPTVSFANDILPLFRQVDIQHMQPMGVNLSDYTYMSTPANAQAVYDHLTGTTPPKMPIGGPYWTTAQLQLFSTWMTTGYNP
jgi:hypothetical protein